MTEGSFSIGSIFTFPPLSTTAKDAGGLVIAPVLGTRITAFSMLESPSTQTGCTNSQMGISRE